MTALLNTKYGTVVLENMVWRSENELLADWANRLVPQSRYRESLGDPEAAMVAMLQDRLGGTEVIRTGSVDPDVRETFHARHVSEAADDCGANSPGGG